MGIVNYFISLGTNHGTFGIFIGALLENTGVPFANTAQVLASGALIANHKATFAGLIVAGTLGNITGSTIGYGIGYFLGGTIRKFRRGVIFKQEDRINQFIAKYGSLSVFLAQLYGATRTVISIPAGMLKMKFREFIIYTTLGGLIFAVAVTLFSFFVRDYYYKFIFPLIGVSFGSVAVTIMVIILVTHVTYRYSDRIRSQAKKLFYFLEQDEDYEDRKPKE